MDFLPVTWFDTLPSTNQYLHQCFAENPDLRSGTVVAARAQSRGRGQFGRAWVSAPGKDLAFSFLYRDQLDLAWVPSLPMAVALGVADALRHAQVRTRLKWPNDVLVSGRKICGILVENIPAVDEVALVVGVGLNVNMDETVASSIDRPVTSILMETGSQHPTDVILESVLASVSGWIDRWAQGGFPAIRKEWIAAAVGLGHKAVVRRADGEICGVLEGFGEFGELLLRQGDGQSRLIWSGDLHTGDSVA